MNLQEMIVSLNSFDSADGIALFLELEGIKGEVQDGESCPISNWILTNTNAVGCSTTEKVITVEEMHGTAFYNHAFNNSDAVEDFIKKFDNWEYPNLIQADPDQWVNDWDDEPEPDGF